MISVGCAVSTSSRDSDSTAFLMVASSRLGWSFSLRKVRAITSGLLAASPFGEILWYCSAVLAKFRNWLNARATGSSSSLDRFCSVVSSSWRLTSLPARDDLDSLRIVSTRSRMCSPSASLMVSPSTLPSILTLLRNAEYCSFINPDTPSLIYASCIFRATAALAAPRNLSDLIFSPSFIKPRKTRDVNCCEIGSANEKMAGIYVI